MRPCTSTSRYIPRRTLAMRGYPQTRISMSASEWVDKPSPSASGFSLFGPIRKANKVHIKSTDFPVTSSTSDSLLLHMSVVGEVPLRISVLKSQASPKMAPGSDQGRVHSRFGISLESRALEFEAGQPRPWKLSVAFPLVPDLPRTRASATSIHRMVAQSGADHP